MANFDNKLVLNRVMCEAGPTNRVSVEPAWELFQNNSFLPRFVGTMNRNRSAAKQAEKNEKSLRWASASTFVRKL